jgi:hypothetical protein
MFAKMRGAASGVAGRIDKVERKQLKRAAAVALAGAGVTAAGIALIARGGSDGAAIGTKMALGGGSATVGGAFGFSERLREALKDGKVGRAAARVRTGAEIAGYGAFEGGKKAIRTLQITPQISAERGVAKVIDWGATSVEDMVRRNIETRAQRITSNSAKIVGQAQLAATQRAMGKLDRIRDRTTARVGHAALSDNEQKLVKAVQLEVLKELEGITTRDKLRIKGEQNIRRAARDIVNQMKSRGQLADAFFSNIPQDVLDRASNRHLRPNQTSKAEQELLRKLVSGEVRSGGLFG